MRVLIIDDSMAMRRMLSAYVSELKAETAVATDGQDALDVLAREGAFDAALVDWDMPRMNGMEFVRAVRADDRWANMKLVMVTAHISQDDIVEALETGADDYLTKPFGTGELLARIRAALRRVESGAAAAEPRQRWSDVEFDLSAREVKRRGEIIHLTPNEFNLLAVLVRHAGKVLTQQQLLKEVWGGVAGAQPHYLRVYMAQLRRKLEADPARPRHLLTELGVGYRLKLE